MIVLRCVRRLESRFPFASDVEVEAQRSASEHLSRLGDWYVQPVDLPHHGPAILCMEERTVAQVLVAADCDDFVTEFGVRYGEVLYNVGISAAVISAELAAARELVFTKTASRSTLGVLRNCVDYVEYGNEDFPHMSLADVREFANRNISSVNGYAPIPESLREALTGN